MSCSSNLISSILTRSSHAPSIGDGGLQLSKPTDTDPGGISDSPPLPKSAGASMIGRWVVDDVGGRWWPSHAPGRPRIFLWVAGLSVSGSFFVARLGRFLGVSSADGFGGGSSGFLRVGLDGIGED